MIISYFVVSSLGSFYSHPYWNFSSGTWFDMPNLLDREKANVIIVLSFKYAGLFQIAFGKLYLLAFFCGSSFIWIKKCTVSSITKFLRNELLARRFRGFRFEVTIPHVNCFAIAIEWRMNINIIGTVINFI